MSTDFFVEVVPHMLYRGDTPLHLAAAALKVVAARRLLERGADVNAENRRGALALHYACDPRPNAGTWNPERQTEVIQLLVSHGAELDHADRGGVTPLHRAVRARSAPAVRTLLAAGARVQPQSGRHGSTPLHLAVQSTGASGTAGTLSEQLEIIELLLGHGADPGIADERGQTPFEWATNARITAALQARS
jgi:ankyrin repeat protein